MPEWIEGSTDVEVLGPSEVFGRQLEGVRRRKGWTQQQLADQLTKLRGRTTSQSAIAHIENGKRQRVPIDEVYEYAVALGVSPIALLVPRDDTRMCFAGMERADKTEGEQTSVSGAEVLEWIRGNRPLRNGVAGLTRQFYDERPDWEAAAIREYPTLLKVMFEVSKILTLTAEYGPHSDEARAAVQALERLVSSARRK